MGKDKIRKFKENETFKCLIQPRMDEVIGKEHPLKGNWDKEVFHNGNPIVLELGCGKGEYTIALAERFPDKNYIGVDIKGARLWRGAKYAHEHITDIDGVKIDFAHGWVHLRKSNTEPIIRVYSEASTMEAADELGKQIMDIVYSLAK